MHNWIRDVRRCTTVPSLRSSKQWSQIPRTRLKFNATFFRWTFDWGWCLSISILFNILNSQQFYFQGFSPHLYTYFHQLAYTFNYMNILPDITRSNVLWISKFISHRGSIKRSYNRSRHRLHISVVSWTSSNTCIKYRNGVVGKFLPVIYLSHSFFS